MTRKFSGRPQRQSAPCRTNPASRANCAPCCTPSAWPRWEPSTKALPRASFAGQAAALAPGSTGWEAARGAYLARFPEAEPMTALGDFQFFAITISAARQIAGFGAARSLEGDDLAAVLRG
jgi:hypothetical protein